MTPTIVVYDACVLYSAALRDHLIHLAGTGLFRAKWTDRIHDEWTSAVLRKRPEIADKLARTRLLMDQAVADARVAEYEPLIQAVNLPDPKDRHVVAAAIKSGAQLIVTFNVKDFPTAELVRWDIEAQHPDDFLVSLLDHNEAIVHAAMRTQRAALSNPPKTATELIDSLEHLGLVKTAGRLAAAISRL